MATLYAKIPLNGFDGYTPEQIAKSLQREFYRISRPPEVRNPDYVTEYLAGWITHTTTGQYAIILPDISVTKNNQASAERLITFLSNRLTDTQKNNVRIYYQRNSAIPIQGLFEYLFPNQMMTRAELDAEGWFVSELN